MEKYVVPEMEIIKFETEDVITTSNGGGNDPSLNLLSDGPNA